MCISGAHSRIRCLKLRLFVHTQVAFVDFLRVSSNFHMVKKESSSCKELKLLSGRVQRFYSLHLSLQSRARSNWLLCLKLSFFKTSAINVEYLHRSLEQKLKSDVWHVENVKEKMIQKRKNSTPGTFYILLLNGVLLKTFIVMSLIKEKIGKTGSKDKGYIDILFRDKNM